MISLPDNYPRSPPEVRLLRPLLDHDTGGIVNGFFTGIPRLLPIGWNPYCSLPICLQWIRDCLRDKEARVNKDTNAFYNLHAYSATRKLIQSHPSPRLRHSTHFEKKLIAYSGAYCESVLQMSMRPDFHYGNKVLLPPATLELLVRSELQDTAAVAQRLRSEGITGTSLAALLTESENSSTSESAMIFELVSPLRYPVYAGVAEFTAPEPNMIILPEPVMSALAIVEGTEITVSRTTLEPATTIILQPHSTSFHAVEEFTGKEPREFLEDSLVSYSCLQAGTVILCGGGGSNDNTDSFMDKEERDLALNHPELGLVLPPPRTNNLSVQPDILMLDNGNFKIIPPTNVFRFNVVSVKPESSNGAVALFVGFQSQVNIEFLPAMDEFSIASPAHKNSNNNDVPIYQGPNLNRESSNTSVPSRSSSNNVNRVQSNTSTGSRYAPIPQAAVEYDPAAHLINGIMPMIPMLGNPSVPTSSGYTLGTSSGNTFSSSSSSSSSLNNYNSMNYNKNTVVDAINNNKGSRLVFNPVSTDGETKDEDTNLPMIHVPSSSSSSSSSTVTAISKGSVLGTSTVTTLGDNSVASSSNPLGNAAAEREARRKMQAEAAAKRFASVSSESKQ